MRRSLISLLAAGLALSCADAPTTPLLMATVPNFVDNPPPPSQWVDGSISSEYGVVSFTADLFINKPGNVAWLRFHTVSNVDGTATVSANARIMSVNGNVSGVGTISIGDNTIQLSEIDTFNYQSYRTTGGVSFSGGSIRQGGAFSKGFGDCKEKCVDGSFDG